jgi:hypothetical protein
MKRELKQKWLAALRSGEYRQGRQELKFKDRQKQICYCCLGVLAEIAEPEKLQKVRNKFLFYGSRGFLRIYPDKWVLLPEETQRQLSAMNDDGATSFLEIADWIEKNVLVEDE